MTRDDQPPMDPHESLAWMVEEFPGPKMLFSRATALAAWWLFMSTWRQRKRTPPTDPRQPDVNCPEG